MPAEILEAYLIDQKDEGSVLDAGLTHRDETLINDVSNM
jgi:hypothetical protein